MARAHPSAARAETVARFKFAKEGPCVLTAQIRDNINTSVQVLNHPPTAKMSFVTRRALSTLIPPKVSFDIPGSCKLETLIADRNCVLGRLSQGTFDFDSTAIPTRHDAIDEIRHGLGYELRQLRRGGMMGERARKTGKNE